MQATMEVSHAATPIAPKAVHTILLVDDNAENLQIFGDLLLPHYAVRAAKNGASALQLAAKLPHLDLILLDIMMPQMDGYEVLRQLRADPKTRNVPVIFVTAVNGKVDEAKGLALGAVDYISKPVVPELLLARVRTQLELKEARDWLADRNASLAAEVARQVVDLKAAKEAAEAASRSKSVFITSMSHELLTPMNGVLGMLQLIDISMRADPTLKGYLDMATQSARATVELINNILEYSSIAHGTVKLFVKTIDVRTWLQANTDPWRPKFARRQLRFNTNVASNVPAQLVCDESRLSRVLSILLDNALKFTSTGVVDLWLESVDSTLHLYLRDTGIGISDEAHARLFKPFEQGDGTSNRSFGGTGLGLTIAKCLLERMGGAIDCTSRAGQGSTFHFTLPLRGDSP